MLSVYQLGARLRIDPNELLDTINGKKVPTQKVLKGLAKELDVSYFDLSTLPDSLRRDPPAQTATRRVAWQIIWRKSLHGIWRVGA